MTENDIEVEDAPSEAMDIDSHQPGSGESDTAAAATASAAAFSAPSTTSEEKEKVDIMEDSEEKLETKISNPTFSKFMQGFWDLASVDVPVRVGAAAIIVRHVSTAEGDAAYAVKRLVRGVCSSRESARQGFASCLAQVLTELPEGALTTSSVLEQVLQTTQTTSGMKGAEERDLILGRLLGVSALAMSGRLRSAPDSAEEALKAVAELHSRRKWLAQAAGEAALLVTLKAFGGQGDFTRAVLPVLMPLLKGKNGSDLEVSDLTPDQLMLSLGLRSIMREKGLDLQKGSALKDELPAFLRSASIVRLGKAQELVAPLKRSASVFPKTHSLWGRLWDDLGLSPAGKPRASLSAKRLKRLGELWSVVVDGALTSTSLNNKGTAILVFKQVMKRVPAAGVCHVLSPGIVRLMLNHTKGEENYLYSLVRMTLKQLPKIVKDDQEVQAQVAACLLGRGSIRFDMLVRMKVVASIVGSMGQEGLDEHMEFLKGVVRGSKPGWTESPGYGESSTSAYGGTAAAEGNGGRSEESAAERLQAVETLYSLARSFSGGSSGEMRLQGERLSKTAEFFLEMGFFAHADGACAILYNARPWCVCSAAAPLAPKMLDRCQSKFFSIVADIASKPLFWRVSHNPHLLKGNGGMKRNPAGGPESSPNGEQLGPGALEALWGLHEAWGSIEGRGRKLVEGVEVGVDEREACSVALAVVGRIREVGDARGDGCSKLGAAFAGILLIVSLHLLEGSKGDTRGQERCQHILDLVETYGRMSDSGERGGRDMKGGGEEDDEEESDDDDPDPLAMLADVLVAVVAEPSAHSVRGLRDTARRAWGMVCATTPLTKSALETLVVAVCGEDDDEDVEGVAPADDVDESSSEDEDEDGDDKEDDDEKEDDEDKRDEESNQQSKRDPDGSAEDQEVLVDAADIEELLQGDGGLDGEGLQHHSGADAALGALLGLKKSRRKRGTLEAQRQGYQIRLRALDLLEVVCGRHPNSLHLLGALTPVIKAVHKLGDVTAKGKSAIGEASALAARLRTLYSNRLCKCKPCVSGEPSTTLPSGGGENPGEGGLATETALWFSQLMGLCRAWQKDAPMASLALQGALCCLRSLKGRSIKTVGLVGKEGDKGENVLDDALKVLVDAVREFFVNKRCAGFNGVQVQEVVTGFPEGLVPVLVSAAEGAAASDFLRAEAFRLLTIVLNRRTQMDLESQEALLAQCPRIFEAVCDALREVGTAETRKGGAGGKPPKETPGGDNLAAPETNVRADEEMVTAGSSIKLKAKRVKPLVSCLSALITARKDGGGGSMKGMLSEVRGVRCAVEAAGESSESLAVQNLCFQVAQEVGKWERAEAKVANGGEVSGLVKREDRKKKKKKQKDDDDGDLVNLSSPGAKRKEGEASRSPASGAGCFAAAEEVEGGDENEKPSTSGKKKKRKKKRESY